MDVPFAPSRPATRSGGRAERTTETAHTTEKEASMVTGAGRRVAVVSGGAAGVGRAAVRELAGRGYDVAILARGAAGLQGAAADVRKAGRRALPIPADVADYEAVRQAAAQAESE